MAHIYPQVSLKNNGIVTIFTDTILRDALDRIKFTLQSPR